MLGGEIGGVKFLMSASPPFLAWKAQILNTLKAVRIASWCYVLFTSAIENCPFLLDLLLRVCLSLLYSRQETPMGPLSCSYPKSDNFKLSIHYVFLMALSVALS